MAGRKPLQINVLGGISVIHGEQTANLPPSKKTRALLAYLALTGREHRRDRLCSLLWEEAEDPGHRSQSYAGAMRRPARQPLGKASGGRFRSSGRPRSDARPFAGALARYR